VVRKLNTSLLTQMIADLEARLTEPATKPFADDTSGPQQSLANDQLRQRLHTAGGNVTLLPNHRRIALRKG
jgi:hypothetical protein